MKIITLTTLFTIAFAGSLFAQTPPLAATPSPSAISKSKIAPKSFDEKALNLQPLPPKDTAISKTKNAPKSFDEKALNPQPLPPKDTAISKTKNAPKSFDEKALNPQPLPPKDTAISKTKNAPKSFDEKALNPQPLPPKDDPRRINRFVLSNGWNARVVGKNLMISGVKGETKATAGNYKTKEGRVIVVNTRGEIAN